MPQCRRSTDRFVKYQLILINGRTSSHRPGEADRRGISNDVQQVRFDVYLNSGEFAGRLILLEEQLMFLSTGLVASSGSKGIAGELHSATRNVAAARLDFSALDLEGRWIYFLDQIKDCRADSKFLLCPELQFVIAEEDGSTLNDVVNCGDLSKDETAGLAKHVMEARDIMGRKSS